MSLFDIFSRHPRGEFSAHADGELAPDRLAALEAHLDGCERCRGELAGIVTLRAALRDLPEVAAPRSFALTPAMAERQRAPPATRTTPSFVAMRVAGAGVAAVLAVVVMLDAGGIVDDSGRGGSDETAATFEQDPANRDAEAGDAVNPQPPIADGDAPDSLSGATAGDGDSDLPTTGGGDGDVQTPEGFKDPPDAGVGGAEDLPPATGGGVGSDGDVNVDEPPDAQSFSGDPDGVVTTADGGEGDTAGDDGKAAAPESGDGSPFAFTAEDDGLSSLLLIEIGLAAVAVLAIGGSFLVRRRAESD